MFFRNIRLEGEESAGIEWITSPPLTSFPTRNRELYTDWLLLPNGDDTNRENQERRVGLMI